MNDLTYKVLMFLTRLTLPILLIVSVCILMLSIVYSIFLWVLTGDGYLDVYYDNEKNFMVKWWRIYGIK